jgi:hypothetical protein
MEGCPKGGVVPPPRRGNYPTGLSPFRALYTGKPFVKTALKKKRN